MTIKTSSYRQSLLTALLNPVEASAYLNAGCPILRLFTGEGWETTEPTHRTIPFSRRENMKIAQGETLGKHPQKIPAVL